MVKTTKEKEKNIIPSVSFKSCIRDWTLNEVPTSQPF